MEWNEDDVQPEQPAEETQELRPAAEPVASPSSPLRSSRSPSPWRLSPSRRARAGAEKARC